MPPQGAPRRPACSSAERSSVDDHERSSDHGRAGTTGYSRKAKSRVRRSRRRGRRRRARRRAASGRNGRTPAAAATPIALQDVEDGAVTVPIRLKRRMTVDDDAQGPGRRRRWRTPAPRVDRARPRALRRAVRRAHRGHEVLGDARPDGDHRAPRGDLAGRRPARTRRPSRPRRFAALMTRIAAGVARRGAAVRADRGHGRRVKDCIVEVMARRGHARRPRGRDRHHRRPAGDRPGLQDAGRPRRRDRRRGADLPRRGARRSAPTRPTSCRSRWTPTGCGSTSSRRRSTRLDARGPAAEVHLHGPDLPEPGRRDDVAARAGGGWSSSPRERELLVLEDNPYGLLRYEGEPLPHAATRSTAATSSSTSAPSRRSSRPASASAGRSRPPPVLEKIEPRQAGRRPLHLDADPATSSRAYFAEGRWRDYVDDAARALPRAGATRCSTRWPSTSRREATWTQPGGRPVHLGDAARLHRHRPTCSRGRCATNVAFVPGPRRLRRRPRRRRRCG